MNFHTKPNDDVYLILLKGIYISIQMWNTEYYETLVSTYPNLIKHSHVLGVMVVSAINHRGSSVFLVILLVVEVMVMVVMVLENHQGQPRCRGYANHTQKHHCKPHGMLCGQQRAKNRVDQLTARVITWSKPFFIHTPFIKATDNCVSHMALINAT